MVCVLFCPVSPENLLAEQKTNVFWISFHNEETLSGYTTAAEPGWICCGSISHISIGDGLGDYDERTAPLCSKGSRNESHVPMNSDILYLFSNTILSLESEDESCRDLFGTNISNYLFPFFFPNKLSLQTTLLPQLLPFGPLLTAFGCYWLAASLSISCSFHHGLLFGRKKSLFCCDDPSVSSPSPERSTEKHMNTCCCTCRPAEAGLCIRPNVIVYIEARWGKWWFKSKFNFPLICFKHWITHLENKNISESGLECSFSILIYFKMNSWSFCHLRHTSVTFYAHPE